MRSRITPPGGGVNMKLVRADVVRGNQLIGSLDRTQYLPSASARLLGNYLCIAHEDGTVLWFDGNLNQTAQTTGEPVEFALADGAWVHVPTQQQAFVPGCTLTAADVSQGAMLVNDALVDLQGRQIIPYGYARIGDAFSDSTMYFPTGYQAVLDNKDYLTFYDETGAVTATSQRIIDFFSQKGFLQHSPIIAVETSKGYALITATHGDVPGVYEDVDISCDGIQILPVKQNGCGAAWT